MPRKKLMMKLKCVLSVLNDWLDCCFEERKRCDWKFIWRLAHAMPTIIVKAIYKKALMDALDYCDDVCFGDSTVGIQPCSFFEFPDINDDGTTIPGGCLICRDLKDMFRVGGTHGKH